MPSVDDLVEGFIRHFYSADRALKWVASEQELSIALADDVILAGRVDAIGDDFFGEWKTLSKWGRSGWREKWRFHPQSLTYGLLLRETHPEVKRFTIRVAFKSDPPSYDHEWFAYSQGELDVWRDQVLHIAEMIRMYNGLEHWPLNPLSCYKYGPKYPCAYIDRCTHQTWDVPVAGLTPRISHLDLERKVQESIEPRKPLVLDATRITKYLECPEDYRGSYVEGGQGMSEPESEALTLGKGFHELTGEYYRQLAAGTLPHVAATAQTFPMGFELQED